MLDSMRAGAVASLIVGASLASSACATGGTFPAANLTEVDLGAADYEIVARGVTGEASATYLLGFSAGRGMMASTFAVARIAGAPFLYRAAIADLWENFAAEHGSIEGRPLALVNVRYDVDALNLILVTRPLVSIRADVVEFVGSGGAGESAMSAGGTEPSEADRSVEGHGVGAGG